jgi:hypothetical protein
MLIHKKYEKEIKDYNYFISEKILLIIIQIYEMNLHIFNENVSQSIVNSMYEQQITKVILPRKSHTYISHI